MSTYDMTNTDTPLTVKARAWERGSAVLCTACGGQIDPAHERMIVMPLSVQDGMATYAVVHDAPATCQHYI